jgi:Protein of unknown function (DUF760)
MAPIRLALNSQVVLLLACEVSSFSPISPAFRHHNHAKIIALQSFAGGSPPRDSGKNRNSGDFLDGFGKEESENMQKAREYLSDEALPISFQFGVNESANYTSATSDKNPSNLQPETAKSGELTLASEGPNSSLGQLQEFFQPPSEDLLQTNPYIKVVSSLTPPELISKFTSTAHPRVQNAVRSTILGLIGGLPKMAFETTTITTGQRLASLMFQLQMTGYLFKNAEYRLSLSQSLESLSSVPIFGSEGLLRLPGDAGHDDDDENGTLDPLKGKIKGKLKIRYSPDSELRDETSSVSLGDPEGQGNLVTPLELEVDAAAYMSELRTEVSNLRDELMQRRKEKEEAIRKDLLLYIRTLPEQQLRSLTGTISQDVLLAMKGLVSVVMAGIGDGNISADTITEQSGESMAQLCMWQLVVGYNLRELEVREEMKNSLLGSMKAESDATSYTEPGAFD